METVAFRQPVQIHYYFIEKTDRGPPPIRARFIRFYSQEGIGGESRFARFGVNVNPGNDKVTR